MRPRLWIVLAVALVLAAPLPALSWGSGIHRTLNRLAVEDLPEPLRSTARAHVSILVDLATRPDERRSTDPDEAPRHFIDLDRYGAYPFDDLPRDLATLISRYGEQRVRANGLLPWTLVEATERLSAAMRERTPDAWETAADVGHYAADANMPLHTTENYDGQKTGNSGAHALFEDVLPSAYWNASAFVPRQAQAPGDLLGFAFRIVVDSHGRIRPLLDAQTRAQQQFARTDPRFYQAIWAEAGQVIVASLDQAAADIASFWLWAWEHAGRPDLGR